MATVFPVSGIGTQVVPPLAPHGGVTTIQGYTPTNTAGTAYKDSGFIPEIWSGKLIEKFYNSTVLAAISNTDYEGEIKNQGDKVRIRTKPTISIQNYSADGVLALERPVGNVIDLLIDKGKYFNTILDDVMEIQSDLNMMSMWADDAAEQMKIKIDTEVLLALLGQAHAKNQGGPTAGVISNNLNLGSTGTPLALVADIRPGAVVDGGTVPGNVTVLDMILRLGQALDEQNIPETGRWLVLPTWVATLIKKSELRQAYLSGDATSMLRNGRVGMVDRFTLYTSNLLPKGAITGPPALAAGEWVVYAGHAHGLTFASQVSKTETLRSEMTFGTIFRGLQVFGHKVIDNVALAQAVVTVEDITP